MSQILWMMSFSATDDDVTTTNDEVSYTGTSKRDVSNQKQNSKQDICMTALVAIIEPMIENSFSKGSKLPSRVILATKLG